MSENRVYLTKDTFNGKLYKRGKFNKGWKERFFTVYRIDQKIEYYSSLQDRQNCNSMCGLIDLCTVSNIQVITNSDSDFQKLFINPFAGHIGHSTKTKSDKKYTFEVVTKKRTYVFSAYSNEFLIKWLKYLQSCLYGQIVKQGWLRRQSNKKKWLNEYFVLNKFQQLKWYDNTKKTTCQGTIDCKKIIKINNGILNDGKYPIELHANKIYIVASMSERDRREWIRLINIMKGNNWKEQLESKENDNVVEKKQQFAEFKIHKRPKDDSSDEEVDNDEDKKEFDMNKDENKEITDDKNTYLHIHKRPMDDSSDEDENTNESETKSNDDTNDVRNILTNNNDLISGLMSGVGDNNDLISGLISNAMAGIGANVTLNVPKTAVEMEDENENENEPNTPTTHSDTSTTNDGTHNVTDALTNHNDLISGLMNNAMAAMGGLGGNNQALISGLMNNAMAGVGTNVAETCVEMKDENENNFEVSPDAKNVTLSHLINIIQTYPKTTEYTLKDIYCQMTGSGSDAITCWSNERVNKGSKEDIWVIFDVSEINIDFFDILFYTQFEQNTLTSVKVFTSKTNSNNEDEWQLIETKDNVVENDKQTFYLKSKHERYIKICIDADAVNISSLRWYGFEPIIHDEITDKIKMYQTCGKFEGTNSRFVSDVPSKSWLIFDCKRYEIDRISLQFAQKSKPKIVNVRLSDVAPRYSFDNIKPVMQWKLKTSELWDDKSWADIELYRQLSFSGTEYNDGFKRYLHLEFSEYIITQLKIESIRFYGKLSQQIAENDEQFDSIFDDVETEEKKQDSDLEPYQFKIIDHSPTMQGPIENIWNQTGHEYWLPQLGTPPYIILDMGNNPVDKIWIKPFSVSAMSRQNYNICKISTNDKISADWQLIIEDNEFDKKATDPEGAKYNISSEIKKYLKIEFFFTPPTGMNSIMASMTAIFMLSSLRLFGNSPFLESLEKKITMDDIQNMKHVDEDLIHLYKKQETEKYYAAAMSYGLAALDSSLEVLSNEWMDAKIKLYNNQALYYYMFTKLDAYQKGTQFEKEETLKIANMQEKLAEKYVKEKLLQNDIEHFKRYGKMEQEHETAKELLDNAKDFEQKALLKKDVEDKLEIVRNENMFWVKKQAELMAELNDKINELYTDNRNENIYKLWKDAIENHAKEISNEYNVYEYTQCLEKYAQLHHKDEYKQLLGKLADLFDESMKQKKELAHKFFIFQLSEYYDQIRDDTFGMKPVMVLFDVGEEYNGKIHRIEFEIDKHCCMNTISVYTKEEKDDNDNFSMIGKLEFNEELKAKKEENGLSFEDTKILLNCKNKRFLKVEFYDFDETHSVRFTIKNVRFYMYDNSEIKDDDEKKDGRQLEKYKLKYVSGSVDDRDGLKKAYGLTDSNTYVSHKDNCAYLIFDCETRIVDKIELKVDDWPSGCRFDKICISTSNDMNENDEEKDTMVNDMAQQMMANMLGNQSQMMQNMMMNAMANNNVKKDKWSVILNDENCFDKFSQNEGETVIINGKNERYLKLAFNLSENCDCVNLSHLKFYTTDPDEYKWDIDENIKNLTSKIKIISATETNPKYKAENMLNPDWRLDYYIQLEKINHKELIEDKIRDEVCRGVNLLRKSGGGKISKHEKHFVKFLLCFQNERNYNEMLHSAKLVMNILRKPLDIEYNRLMSINSKLLTLKLDKKNKCKENIKSNHQLLESSYNKWYVHRTAMFWPKDLKYLSAEWIKLGLNLTDPEFKQLRKKSILEPHKSFVSSDDLAMEYLNLIAHKINPSFQQAMRNLFKQNRTELNLQFPINDNKDLGVQSGPVKTKARQKIKVDLKYYSHKPPQCMSVLDIVRCAIICIDDNELCSLFELIMKTYSGSIMRVKNAFDDIKKGEASHGYRAVMINMAFGGNSAELPNGYEMVCEVQLLLLKYYEVRKNMHLGYGITRSEDGGLAENKKPYKVLARDSCKFGKLDI